MPNIARFHLRSTICFENRKRICEKLYSLDISKNSKSGYTVVLHKYTHRRLNEIFNFVKVGAFAQISCELYFRHDHMQPLKTKANHFNDIEINPGCEINNFDDWIAG